ncbi:MAG: Gfo/Idh/MocA family oxidoreductase [Planctomycetes bacterium]|nr:Gfo/Idh/MocA family oxidoreductase [Planctomycetota bacterium]
MTRHGVVVIGCGVTGSMHCQSVCNMPSLQLLGVVDIIDTRARDFAERFRADEWSTDYHKFLNHRDCDLVIVTTWPSSHRQIVIDFLKAGKHVLCEKPLAPTLKDVDEIIATVKETGRKLLVGYIIRHNASYKKIKVMIDEGQIGSPIIMRMLGGEHPIEDEHWRRDVLLAKETSPIIDCGCHYVDIMRWFTRAEVLSVSGVGLRLSPEIPEGKYDYGIITVRLNDGSVGIYEVGWTRNYRNFSEKEFVGPKGRIRLIYREFRGCHPEEGDLIEYYSYPGHYEIINVKGVMKRADVQLQYMVDMIEHNEDPMQGLEDARKSLEIVLTGDEVIRKGLMCSSIDNKRLK